MRKFILLCVAAIMAISVTSCNSCSNSIQDFGFTYELATNGDADGHFDVSFEQGFFDINGQAEYKFNFSNDTTKVVAFQKAPAIALDEAMLAKSATYEAAVRTSNWLDEQLKITEYSGTYLLHIQGYVYEHLTGIKFEVDRTFTNRVNDEPAD